MPKMLVEDCLALSISELFRGGSVVDGSTTGGTLEWSVGSNPLGTIAYEADLRTINHANLRLQYARGAERQDYFVWLSITPLHFGRHRWWMHCPISSRRVGILYLPDDQSRFACRQEYGLTYKSCQESRRSDADLKRLAKWKKRLGRV